MIQAFLTGFFLGLSLIVAIGAQNAFVLKQGILGQHVFYLALFCSLSDALLIMLGVAGVSFFIDNFNSQVANILFGFSAIWLLGYGIIRLIAVFQTNSIDEFEVTTSKSLLSTISIAAILTFGNPHVYIDTMILIGTVSQQFSGNDKMIFTLGACLASFVFFFTLSYTAKLLKPLMQSVYSWKILDTLIAVIMFIIAFKLASEGNWI